MNRSGEEVTIKRINNKGVSLIELIVVIAIIATLSGLVTPQLMKYVSQKREMACNENREAIINDCEKMVYARQCTVDFLDGKTVNESNIDDITIWPAGISAEIKEDIKRHANCPEGGVITITTSGATVQCSCSVHSTKASVDLTTWSGVSVSSEDPEVRP